MMLKNEKYIDEFMKKILERSNNYNKWKKL